MSPDGQGYRFMTNQISSHDAERDRIASSWSELSSFVCEACKDERTFPPAVSVRTEVRFDGPLRADVAAFDAAGNIVGVVEVVRSNPPSAQVLASQKRFDFAFTGGFPTPTLITSTLGFVQRDAGLGTWNCGGGQPALLGTPPDATGAKLTYTKTH